MDRPVGLLTLFTLCLSISAFRVRQRVIACTHTVWKFDAMRSTAGAFLEAKTEMTRIFRAFHALPPRKRHFAIT